MPFFWQRSRVHDDESRTHQQASDALLGAGTAGDADSPSEPVSLQVISQSDTGRVPMQDGTAFGNEAEALCARGEERPGQANGSGTASPPVAVTIGAIQCAQGRGSGSVSPSASSAPGADRTGSLPTCLICLEVMDTSDASPVVSLGCQCKGSAAFRHRECLDRWLTFKGDTLCDVCGAPMASVRLPPPPPVPGYVVRVFAVASCLTV